MKKLSPRTISKKKSDSKVSKANFFRRYFFGMFLLSFLNERSNQSRVVDRILHIFVRK